MQTIALDLGGTKVLGGIFSDDQPTVPEICRPVRVPDVAGRVRLLCELARELQAEAPAAAAIGIAFPARVDADRGFAQAPGGEWVDVAGIVADATGLRTTVDNDASAALVAELRCGAAQGSDATFLLTVGTDLGGAVAIDGRVRRGRTGLAGEIHGMFVGSGAGDAPERWGDWVNGERLGEEGTAIARASDHGLLHDALAPAGRLDGRIVTELALAGDPGARSLLSEFGERLALGVANVIRVFEPEVVVVGGGVARAGDLLLDPFRAALREELPPGHEVRVSLARLGERASLVGAAILAREAILPRPEPMRLVDA